MVKVKREIDDGAIGKRKRNRIRRNNDEIQKDVVRYYQLLDEKNDLEKDIPPRRTNVKEEVAPVEYRRLRSRKQPQPPLPTFKKKSTLVRPKYMGSKPSTPIFERKVVKNPPPKLSQLKSNNYQHRIMLENTYDDLIKTINNSIDVKNPEQSAIDISLHHNFIAKNINHEQERFKVTDFWQESPLNYKSFNSGDIDLFFENINGGFSVEESSKNSKANIPLV